jgi:ATP synthase subunit 6
MLLSPLEQFRILPLISLRLGNFDFSLVNSVLILFIGLSSFIFLLKGIGFSSKYLNLVPKAWQNIIETLYLSVSGLIKDSVGIQGQIYFPFVFVLFSFILVANLIGLVPYSFTMTSHLIVTLSLAITIFFGVNFIGIKKFGSQMFSLFLPGGTSLGLALLLIPIEIVSYIFKPISLAVRLFANMMAGHTLLKVIAGFAWAMISGGSLLIISSFIPLLVLVLLVGLELGVSLIQAYVFTILTCIYLGDIMNLESH